MAPWGWVAGGYGLLLAGAAAGLTGVQRRVLAASASAGYACLALGAATLSSLAAQLVVPGLLLLGGYWLSGFFFRDPQPWLERWLVDSDRRIFRALAVDRFLAASPTAILEVLEASYTADYIVVGGGAFLAAAHGTDAVSRYWTIVLAAELACYAALPWLRSRPPRVLEPPGIIARRAPALRRLNVRILDRASVQANTLPSGHVAGASAAALAIGAWDPLAGGVLMAAALLIAASAALGRYHYVVDCALGAVVAVSVWLAF
jgi:PAP2 superfamily